jgi:hypothetical protein
MARADQATAVLVPPTALVMRPLAELLGIGFAHEAHRPA